MKTNAANTRETIARLNRCQAERIAKKMNACRTIIGYGAVIVLGEASDDAFIPLVAEAPSALGAARARGYVEAYLDTVETDE